MPVFLEEEAAAAAAALQIKLEILYVLTIQRLIAFSSLCVCPTSFFFFHSVFFHPPTPLSTNVIIDDLSCVQQQQQQSSIIEASSSTATNTQKGAVALNQQTKTHLGLSDRADDSNN